MSNNKKIYLLITLALLSGCSVKKDAMTPSASDTSTTSVTNVTSDSSGLGIIIDTDSDGIPDAVEITRKTNPLIADIPRIGINLVSEISLSGVFREEANSLRDESIILKQVFNEIQGERAGDVDFLKVLRRKVVKNQYTHLRNIQAEKEDVIINEDLRTSILSRWDDKLFYPVADSLLKIENKQSNPSGKYNANVKLKITNAAHVTQISNINLKSIYYNFKNMEESEIYNQFLLKQNGSKEKIELFGKDEFIPAPEYNLFANELETSQLADKIMNRNEVGLKFVSYDYLSSGIQLNYSEVISNVLNNNAKIIFSNGKVTEVHFVAPSSSLKGALEMLGKKLDIDKNGDVLSIDGIETNAIYPVDLDVIKNDDLERGIWSIYGESDNLSAELKPQGIYIVSYSNIADLLEVSRRDYEHYPVSDTQDKIFLKKIYKNDEVIIQVSSIFKNEYYPITTSKRYIKGGNGPGCMAIPNDPLSSDKKGGADCKQEECIQSTSRIDVAQRAVSLNASDYLKWIKVKTADGRDVSFEIFNYSNIIKIKFNKQLNYSRNDLIVYMQNDSEPVKSYSTGVSDACYKQSFGSETRKDFYGFNKKVTIYGAARF